jgi:hypothetical protein
MRFASHWAGEFDFIEQSRCCKPKLVRVSHSSGFNAGDGQRQCLSKLGNVTAATAQAASDRFGRTRQPAATRSAVARYGLRYLRYRRLALRVARLWTGLIATRASDAIADDMEPGVGAERRSVRASLA